MAIKTENASFQARIDFYPQPPCRCPLLVTCSRAVVPLWEFDLDLVLPGDVLDAAAFGPHDGAVVALRNRHLHTHLGLLGRTRGQRSLLIVFHLRMKEEKDEEGFCSGSPGPQ